MLPAGFGLLILGIHIAKCCGWFGMQMDPSESEDQKVSRGPTFAVLRSSTGAHPMALLSVCLSVCVQPVEKPKRSLYRFRPLTKAKPTVGTRSSLPSRRVWKGGSSLLCSFRLDCPPGGVQRIRRWHSEGTGSLARLRPLSPPCASMSSEGASDSLRPPHPPAFIGSRLCLSSCVCLFVCFRSRMMSLPLMNAV